MPSWLEQTERKLGNLVEAEFFKPQGEVEENDHVVGTASPELQRLYSLATSFKKKAMELALELKFSNDQSSQVKGAAKIAKLAAEADVLLKIFWISLKDEFNLWDKDSVGVRQDWQVVWTEEPDVPPPIIRLLGDLFGR